VKTETWATEVSEQEAVFADEAIPIERTGDCFAPLAMTVEFLSRNQAMKSLMAGTIPALRLGTVAT